MPELPEVETVARQLDPLLSGRFLERIDIYDDLLKRVKQDTGPLKNSLIMGVTRFGKQVAFELRPPHGHAATAWLLVHLRMTGRLIWAAGEDPPVEQAGRQPRVRLKLREGSVYFFDVRRFGTFEVSTSLESRRSWAIDPMQPEFTAPALHSLMAGSNQELKAWLLRQDRLVGIGNIYASEILHRAGLSPRRSAESLSSAEVRRVHKATRDVLSAAIEHCGTTFSDFQQSSGEIGGFQRFLRVYQREGQPCRKCRGPIERIVQQQRSTFFCPVCQI